MSKDESKKAAEEEALASMNPNPTIWPGQSESGVDLTLLIENLKMTPTERLEQNRAALKSVEELRRAAHAAGLLKNPGYPLR